MRSKNALRSLLHAGSAAAAALALAACVSTEVASQTAPEFRDHRFQRVLVVADVGMLHDRTLAEDRIVEKLSRRRVDAVRSLDVVFAADTLPEEAFLDHAAREGADAVMMLRVIDEGATRHYVPPTTSSTFFAHGHGHHGVVTGHASLHTYGGRTVFRPWARFRASLIETATGQVAWYADATVDGTSDNDQTDLVRSVADKIAARLLEDEVLRVAQRM